MAGSEGIEGTNAPVRGLEPRFYTDPSVYAEERERIFFRTWQYACHQSEVEHAGDFVVFEIAEQSLFVIRGTDGELRAFYNVCQHRAHELLQGEGNRQFIACPYHAWTYETNGRLKRARGADRLPGFDSTEICLTPVRLESFCGFLFVNLDQTARPMEEWYASAADDLRSHVPDIENHRPIYIHHVDEACNWKIAVENYNECYHCKVVHPAFTKGVIDPESIEIRPRAHTIRHSARAVSSGTRAYDIGDSDAYRVIYLWPSIAIQVYPGRVVNTYWWRARGVVSTRTYRGWLTPGGVRDENTLKIADLDRETTFAEDLPVLHSVQRGMSSRGYRPGPLVINPEGGPNDETSVHAIHRWVLEALAGG
ncbi:MAG: aromatic ring-hydroxylating dioxygenase subunit alpha [Gammaproteobacteria bacterium]|nr:aromatic ring-hydroxylating dioxygenase subunit alpha [Gammaproteobacteria bacterium]